MPQLAPQRPSVSNSGPSQTWSPNRWTWRQASGHCVQARILVRAFRSCAESMRSACSNCPVRQLRVGSAPAALTRSTRNGVPSS